MKRASRRIAEHAVGFFERDDYLCQAAADFVRDGFAQGERAVLLATPEHWAQIQSLLRAQRPRGFKARDVIFLDALDVVQQITADGGACASKFTAILQSAIDRVRRPFRVFGEVVSLVASHGDIDAAVDIEQLAHALAHEVRARVFCAYDLQQLSAANEHLAAIAASHDVVSRPLSLDGPLLLLADDSEDGRELYREYLEFRGFRVITADDGIDALERARASIPALVLLDVRMPRMSGIEAMEELKRDPRFNGVPIVALTAHALESERAAFLSKGFDAVVPKPCLPDELVRIIEALLQGKPVSA